MFIFPEKSAVRYFSLGRFALLEALKIANVSSGDRVLLPAFICRDLLASIHQVGAEPIFYQVNPFLVPLDIHGLPNAKAIIAVNYFGFPQDLKTFREYCAKHGSILIEDNAHGFLSRDDDGKALGSRGDMGIFSLRKTFSLPDGAALLINKRDLSDSLSPHLPCRNEPLSNGFMVKNFLRKVQNTTGLPVRSFSESVTRFFRKFLTGSSLPKPDPESEFKIDGSPEIHCESLNRLATLDLDGEVERRRGLYQRFHENLGGFDIKPIFGELPLGVVPYGYPFRATESDALRIGRFSKGKGFDCFRWPDLPQTVVKSASDYYLNVWWINFLW